MFNTPKFRLLIIFFMFLFFGAAQSNARSEYPESAAEAYDKIMAMSQCSDPGSKACEELLLAHYCKYEGLAVHCSAGKFALIEEKLNASYLRLLEQLKKIAKDGLAKKAPKYFIEAQRAWVLFREKECRLIAESYDGGTLQPAIEGDCKRDAAQARIVEFDRIAEGFGIQKGRNPQ